MKKVCHVISGYYRNDARVFQRQCKSLQAAGFEVVILTNDNAPDEVLDGIHIYSCPLHWNSRKKVLVFAKRQFYKKALEIDADIYQMHSPELLSLGVALKKHGKAIIYDAHEDLPRHITEKEWIPPYMRKGVSVIVERLMNKWLKKYDAIVSPHTHVVNYMQNLFKDVSLVANFPLVHESADFTYECYEEREYIMCYTGTVYLYSNQEAILDAMKEIPDIHYEIAGFIGEAHHTVLKQHSSFTRSKFLGRIPFQELGNFYARMLMGIVIYDYKHHLGYKLGSYGTNKIFEYMEAGLPIICTDYVLWKEIVNKYNCGICVEPGNVKQISEAIRFLLENKKIAYDMGQNGRRAVIEEYNWSTQEYIYVDIFKRYGNDANNVRTNK